MMQGRALRKSPQPPPWFDARDLGLSYKVAPVEPRGPGLRGPAASRLTRRLLIAAGLSLSAAPAAFAHRSQSVLTVISWNPNTSMIEVSHRMHAHDAEVGLAASTGEADATAVDITVVANQAKLMLYIETHFSLVAGSVPIRLDPLGAELEAEAILVYQEAKLLAPPAELTIENRILRDVFDAQTNLVNVRMAQRTRTLLFAGNDGAKTAKDLLQ